MSHVAYLRRVKSSLVVECPRSLAFGVAVSVIVPKDRWRRVRLTDGRVMYHIGPEWTDAVLEVARFHFVQVSDFASSIVEWRVKESEWRPKWERLRTDARQTKLEVVDHVSRDPRQVLFVTEGAPDEVIDAAYRALAKLYHSDVTGEPDDVRMVEINVAYGHIKAERGQTVDD